jgi:hypothetical protein
LPINTCSLAFSGRAGQPILIALNDGDDFP